MAPTESPYEVVIMVASWAVLVTTSVMIVRRDETRLTEDQLERAWSPASRDNALIGLAMLLSPLAGLFAVWFHFVRTRSPRWPWIWSLKGMAFGFAAVSTIIAANVAVVLTLAYALGLPLDE